MNRDENYLLLEKYFHDRPELRPTPPFPSLKFLRSDALESFQQSGLSETERRYELSPDTLIGYKDRKLQLLGALDNFAVNAAQEMYGLPHQNICVQNRYLMTKASSYPLRIDLTIRHKDSHIAKTMYLKPFDAARIIGIELYSMIGGMQTDYNFIFNREFVVEDSLEGKHEFELKMAASGLPNYTKERIKLDALCFFLGLDDMSKKDNYVVSPSTGDIKVVDLDVMSRAYTRKSQSVISRLTARELEISYEKYKKIYKVQNHLMTRRVRKHRGKIHKLLESFTNARDEELRDIACYILNNVKTRIRNIQ